MAAKKTASKQSKDEKKKPAKKAPISAKKTEKTLKINEKKNLGKEKIEENASTSKTVQSSKKSKPEKSLEGKVFAISGTLSSTRDQVIKAITDRGGTYSASITKSVTHLITNSANVNSAKILKAKSSGVSIVDEGFVLDVDSPSMKGSSSNSEQGVVVPSKKKAKTEKSGKLSAQTDTLAKDAAASASNQGMDRRIDVMKEVLSSVSVPKVKAWKVGEAGQPAFSKDYEIIANVVLQVTNIGNNNNKYYALELHESVGMSPPCYRLFTHYGRTDDLTTRGHTSGQREQRYFSDLTTTKAAYQQIYREKTRAAKGYQPVNLVSSKIGSEKAVGRSAGNIGDKTQALMASSPQKVAAPKAVKKNTLHPKVSDLIQYLYSEATNQLTTTVNCEITANGIETPLGILSLEQVESGESILQLIHGELKKKNPQSSVLSRLSGDFYTTIPHKIGRSAAAIASSTIRDMETLAQKQELCELMRDMLQVNSKGENVLFYTDKVMEQYEALDCSVECVEPSSKEFEDIVQEIIESQQRSHGVNRIVGSKIKGLYRVRRQNEEKRFANHISNQQLLYHGSRPSNFVGLLSRGILLPKIVVSMGINRTDGGWLGDGIYFGNADTAYGYAHVGKRSTKMILINKVALGKVLDYNKITYGIKEPKPGYDSCHGVAGTQFYDDEYVVYNENQQKMQYLIETSP